MAWHKQLLTLSGWLRNLPSTSIMSSVHRPLHLSIRVEVYHDGFLGNSKFMIPGVYMMQQWHVISWDCIQSVYCRMYMHAWDYRRRIMLITDIQLFGCDLLLEILNPKCMQGKQEAIYSVFILKISLIICVYLLFPSFQVCQVHSVLLSFIF